MNILKLSVQLNLQGRMYEGQVTVAYYLHFFVYINFQTATGHNMKLARPVKTLNYLMSFNICAFFQNAVEATITTFRVIMINYFRLLRFQTLLKIQARSDKAFQLPCL
jgi:hypothetical protein